MTEQEIKNIKVKANIQQNIMEQRVDICRESGMETVRIAVEDAIEIAKLLSVLKTNI